MSIYLNGFTSPVFFSPLWYWGWNPGVSGLQVSALPLSNILASYLSFLWIFQRKILVNDPVSCKAQMLAILMLCWHIISTSIEHFYNDSRKMCAWGAKG
jgi:hypothetical protein